MRTDVRHGDNHPTLVVALGRGESVAAAAGAMMTVDDGIRVRQPEDGGIRDAAGNRTDRTPVEVVGFVARQNGEVTLAPPLPGDIARVAVGEHPVFVVQAGSFLAAQEGVNLRTTADPDQSLRGGGLSLLQMVGSGAAFLAGYGAVEGRSLDDGERLTADAGHVVAFSQVDLDLQTVEGLRSAVFEDEGVIARFTGPGRVWLQTRSHDAYLAWLRPQLANLR